MCIIPDPEVMSRGDWGALPPTKPHELNGYRVGHVVVTLNSESPVCSGFTTCCKVVQDIQKEHMDKGCTDIPYNFLISSDGMVWEGRGWRARACEHLAVPTGMTRKTPRLDIALIDYQNPPMEIAEAIMMLLGRAMKKKYLSKKYVYHDLDHRYEYSFDKTDEEDYDVI